MSHRIVSLISSATEIVCALGFEDDLVGRSHECDYPRSIVPLPSCSTSKVHLDAAGQAIDSQVRSIVAEGLSVYRVDPDLLNELAPTVIVTQTQCDVCAVSLSDVEQAVCELVTSRPAIVALEPMGLGDIWVPELVDCAGGENRFGEAGKHSGYLDAEALFAADPDVIAVMPCGFNIDRARREMQPLAGRPEWSRLQAVRNGRVVMCDGNQYFNRPGPRVVESAEILAECLHPGGCDFGHRGRGWRPWQAA